MIFSSVSKRISNLRCCNEREKPLNHLMPVIHFHTFGKHQKTSNFLKFSEGIDLELELALNGIIF